jgi:hypothetical protein
MRARARSHNDGSVEDRDYPSQRYDRHTFYWLLPGEGRVAFWAMGRVQNVQGNSKELVAGGYTVLAAIWGSLGGVIGLVGIALD